MRCPGPLIWYDTDGGAILECAACSYVVLTGNLHDLDHYDTPVLREGLHP